MMKKLKEQKAIAVLLGSERRRYVAFILGIVIILTGVGFIIGRTIGSRMLQGILLGRARLPLLISRPVSEFYIVYQLIYSDNPLHRLSGYYSLVDNNLIDVDFLIDRYKQEKEVYLKRTILWVLSFSYNPGDVLKFYATLYDSGSEEIRTEILRSMKRLDYEFCKDFARRKNIKSKVIEDL